MFREKKAQMCVEMALVTPVMIALGLIAVNIFWFLQSVAAFERLAPSAVLVRAASPSAQQTINSMDEDISSALQQQMGKYKRVTVQVHSHSISRDDAGRYQFSLAPHLQEFTCEMSYQPWPALISISFVSASPPGTLKRSKKIVVDPYRSGVVL